MSIKEWDKELKTVTTELKAIHQAHHQSRSSSTKQLIAKKIAIIQAQLNLERNLSHIKKLTERQFPLLPREKALVYWVSLYAEQVQKFFPLRTKLLSRFLWLKLIKVRAHAAEQNERNIMGADDLIELAIRQTNLSKTEKFLAGSLLKLKQRRKELMQRYSELDLAAANQAASRCLSGRLGATLRDALNSPEIRALGLYIKSITMAVSQGPSERRFKVATSRYAKETTSLVHSARNFVLGSMTKAEPVPSTRDLARFRNAMRQLDELEADTRQAYEQLRSSEPETTSKPILMQKSPKQATTVSSA